ncbi:IS66 family transposase [Calditrichota bacterium LG25]
MNATETQPTYQQLLLQVAFLKEENARLRKMIFGQKRERFIPVDTNQLSLDFGDQVKVDVKEETIDVSYKRRKSTKKITPHGRQSLPSHLPRKDVVIEPEKDVSGLKKIGEEVTEELEYKPGQLYVKRFIRPKYIDPSKEKIHIAQMPSRPLEKSIAGPGLLAHIVISKYVDHLPIYRQQQIFKREKVDLPRSTMDNWLKDLGTLFEPLYEAQKERMISKDYLMADETTIKVLDKKHKGKSHTGYYWVYYSPLDKEVYFDYQQGRGRAGPTDFLADYQGALQTDGYAVYDRFDLETGITLLGCLAHARRKFYDARDNDRKRSEWMLGRIQQLYEIESLAREKGLTYNARFQFRQEKALPILTEMETWLAQEILAVTPKSTIGKAIQYMTNRWPYLKRYVEDGRYEIDNNLVENAIRPIALGRKNYLFSGSHNGAKRSAIFYTLVSNAKLQGLEPFSYLRDILENIADYPVTKISELLPVNFKNL